MTLCLPHLPNFNLQKELEDLGESGQTFMGMIKWIENSKTPIVILENVSGAPWDKKVELFEKRGYEATFSRMDTKQYYM